MESNPVRWFEIYVQDIGRAKSFYGVCLSVEIGEAR
jgi:predicted enzyme related to lactoylglutathione lyase